MVKKDDLLKIFFVYLCLWHVVPGHPCGTNPLQRVRHIAQIMGQDVTTVLTNLQERYPAAYRQLQADWRTYADCVGLVDTGYFKRAVRSAVRSAVRKSPTARG